MKNKVLTIMLIMLIAIALIGVLAVVVINNMNNTQATNQAPTADEIVAASVEIPEITTNLAGSEYIKISFMIQTDSKKAKEELDKRNFQAKNIIITQLSEMKGEELTGKAGKEKLQEAIKNELNKIMQEGKVEQVYITSLILQ